MKCGLGVHFRRFKVFTLLLTDLHMHLQGGRDEVGGKPFQAEHLEELGLAYSHGSH